LAISITLLKPMLPFRHCHEIVVACQWIEIKAAVRTDNVAHQRRYPYRTAYLPLASPLIFGALFLDLSGASWIVLAQTDPWAAIGYQNMSNLHDRNVDQQLPGWSLSRLVGECLPGVSRPTSHPNGSATFLGLPWMRKKILTEGHLLRQSFVRKRRVYHRSLWSSVLCCSVLS